MIGYWLIVCHLFGDYALQSDWMARHKSLPRIEGWVACAAHSVVYTLPFLFLFGFQWEPLLLIGGTHFAIDHWRLARYVCWAKNILGPKSSFYSWGENSQTGFKKGTPDYLATWLLIITDNAFHLAFNGMAAHFWF